MAAKKTQPAPDLTVLLLIAGVVGMCIGVWYGLPGVALLLLAMVAGAFSRPYPELTGKDPRTKQPSPMGSGEASKLRKYRFSERLKYRLLVPGELLTPGWPIQWSWIAGVLTGVLVWDLVPAPAASEWYAVVNGVCAAAMVVVLMSAKRQTMSDHEVCPGGTSAALVPLLRKRTLFMVVTGLLGAVGGAVLSYVLAAGFYAVWWAPSNLGFFSPLAGAALGVCLAWAKTVSDESLKQWRAMESARTEWIPRWDIYCGTKVPPRLLGRRTVGAAIIDLFEDNSGVGAPHYIASVDKIKNLCDPANQLFILEAPSVDGNGQPQPGTIHPNRFETVQFPGEDLPNITVQSTPLEAVELWLRCAMSATAVRTRIGRLMLESVELISPEPESAGEEKVSPSRSVDRDLDGKYDDDDEDAPARPRGASRLAKLGATVGAKLAALGQTVERAAPVQEATDAPAVYYTVWDDSVYGPPLLDFRRDYNGEFTAELGAGSLVNHSEDAIFVGNLAALATRFDDQERRSSKSSVSIMDLVDEDHWNGIWGALDKNKANPPKFQAGVGGTAMSGGVLIKAQSFLTLRGIDPRSYFGQEPSLATAMDQKPFVCVTGYIDTGAHRPGERNPQGLSVYYSDSAVLSNPEELQPTPGGNGDLWVLTGRMNSAFKDAKLSPPQVYKVEALTDRRSRGNHVWKIHVRLYDGVTVQMLRVKMDAMRGSFGARWLQVDEQTDDGCIIVVGTTPEKAAFAEGVAGAKAKAYMTALEWVSIFYKADVTKSGLTPRLKKVGALEKNPQVAILDFEMPGGMEFADVREKSKRLADTSLNRYVDVRVGEEPGQFRMLVSRENPMPTSTGFDFDCFDANPGKIPFATGVEGEPIFFDPKNSPHALLAGVTGAGKAEPLTSFIPTPKGWSSIGDLRVGDEVFDRRGQVTTISDFSPVTMEEKFTVNFDDGQCVPTSANHLWRVRHAQVPFGVRAASTHVDEARNQSELVRKLLLTSRRSGTFIGSLATLAHMTGAPVELLELVAGADLAVAPGIFPVAEVALLAAEHSAWAARMGVDPLSVAPEVSIVSTKNLSALLADGTLFVEPLGAIDGGVRAQNSHSAGLAAATSGTALDGAWLRTHHQDRLSVLAGMIAGGSASAGASEMVLVLGERALAAQATELVRTLGGWAHEPVLSVEDEQRQWTVTFSLPALDVGHSARGARITSVDAGGAPVPMRCLMVNSADHTYLSGRFVPTHNSVLAQAFIYGFAVGCAELYIIDPMKGGADFKFVEPYAKAFADDIFKGAGLMKHIYSEVMRRKDLNAKYGVSGISELPEDVRPPMLVVMIDEFTSLTAPSAVPPKSDDVEMERDREAIIAENLARGQIGSMAGKLAREARSAGVVLLLGTQKMTATMLDKIPNGSDLKTNLARVLLGAASQPERMSAFRNPETAAVLGTEVPKGRGIWESLTDSGVMIQVWFATQTKLGEALAERREPLSLSEKTDMSKWMSPAEREQLEIMSAAERKVAQVFGDEGDLVFDLSDLTMDEISLEVDEPEPEPDPNAGFFEGTFDGGPVSPVELIVATTVPDIAPPAAAVHVEAPAVTVDDGWGMEEVTPAATEGEDFFSLDALSDTVPEPAVEVPAPVAVPEPTYREEPVVLDVEFAQIDPDDYAGPDARDFELAAEAGEATGATQAPVFFTSTPLTAPAAATVVDVSGVVANEDNFWPPLQAALAWVAKNPGSRQPLVIEAADVDEENDLAGLGLTNREMATDELDAHPGGVKFILNVPELEKPPAPEALVEPTAMETVEAAAPPSKKKTGLLYPKKSLKDYDEF